jgi:hypothetical protein
MWLVLAAGAVFAVALGQEARAQEVCVQCDGPLATYRCQIADLDKVGQFRGRDRAIEYVCITELARQGRHDRCRVARDFGNVCLGDQRRLSWSARANDVEAKGAPAPDGAQGSSENVESEKSGPPRTLVEVARNTVEQSKKTAKSAGEKIEKAGDAVGGAVKKTWNCLVSFFSVC